jgi:hypothetical protein
MQAWHFGAAISAAGSVIDQNSRWQLCHDRLGLANF